MKIGDYTITASYISNKELGAMFADIAYLGKKVASINIPFLGKKSYTIAAPVAEQWDMEIYSRFCRLAPPMTEEFKKLNQKTNGEDWIVILVNAWLRMEKKAKKLFRNYPDAAAVGIVFDRFGIPTDVAALSSRIPEKDYLKVLQMTAQSDNPMSFLVVPKAQGFAFPRWPVPGSETETGGNI